MNRLSHNNRTIFRAVLSLLPSGRLGCCQGLVDWNWNWTRTTEGAGHLSPIHGSWWLSICLGSPLFPLQVPPALVVSGYVYSHAGHTARRDERTGNDSGKLVTNHFKTEKKFLIGFWNTQEERKKSLLLSPGCVKRAVKRDRWVSSANPKCKAVISFTYRRCQNSWK